jgi:large repetitive protein
MVDGSRGVRSYLRFNLRGLAGAVSYATLQLSVMDSSTRGLVVRQSPTNRWREQSVRFANAPPVRSTPTARSRVVPFHTASIDVSKFVRDSGAVTLVIGSRGPGAASIASGEGPRILRPQLVVGVNSTPTCVALALTTFEDTPGRLGPVCSDAENERLSYRIVSQGTQGTASVAAGKLRYVPEDDLNGPDRFLYQARDRKRWSKPAAVIVNIRRVNDPPTCAARSLTVDEDGGAAVGAQCSDVEGDSLVYSITSAARRGSAFVIGGKLRYFPLPNANGPDSFSCRARDASLPSAPATVSVDVHAVNDVPACADRGFNLDEDAAHGDVEPLCIDPEGDPHTIELVDAPAKGTATLVDGVMRYVPDGDANGADNFTYRASDQTLVGPPATVSVTIAPVNDAPVCADVSLETLEDTPGERVPSCADVDGDVLTYSIVAQGTKGTASVVAAKLRYAPHPGLNGPDTFTYRANDRVADSMPATVSVTIQPVGAPAGKIAVTVTP